MQPLTKSQFMHGLVCPKLLWLERNRPELADPPSEATRLRMRAGIDIGVLARGLADGVLVHPMERGVQAAADATLEAIAGGTDCLYEATFVSEGRAARVDILRRSGRGWLVEEVKSSTAKSLEVLVASGRVHEVAFQMNVARDAGLSVTGGALVALNGAYRCGGQEHDLRSLFSRTDVTAECERLGPEVDCMSWQMLDSIARPEPPQVDTNKHCDHCVFHGHCHANQPKHDVVFLPTLKGPDVTALRARGYATIDQIPDDYKLSKRAALVRKVIRTGSPYLSSKLQSAIESIRFPAAFIDFESFMPALPVFPDTKVYQQICFQWSAHVLQSAAADAVHVEYLHEDASDPRAEFCRTLVEAIRDCATVVHYAAFELVRLREMAEANIPYAQELHELMQSRAVDLEKIVRENVYFEEFNGRTSIKTVLPVLVPGLSYKEMKVADGNAAIAAFLYMTASGTSAEEARSWRDALSAYCKLDTFAMVEIYRALDRLGKDMQPEPQDLFR